MSITKYTDDVTGREYVYDARTGEVAWSPPQAMVQTTPPAPPPPGLPLTLQFSDEEKSGVVFDYYDGDGDGFWSFVEAAVVMEGVTEQEYSSLCRDMCADATRGLSAADVCAMYLSERNRSSLARDFAAVMLRITPESPQALEAEEVNEANSLPSTPPLRELVEVLPPQEHTNHYISGKDVKPARRKQGSRARRADRNTESGQVGNIEHLQVVPPKLTSNEQALVEYYNGLLYQSYYQQEQLKHLTWGAVRHATALALAAPSSPEASTPSPDRKGLKGSLKQVTLPRDRTDSLNVAGVKTTTSVYTQQGAGYDSTSNEQRPRILGGGGGGDRLSMTQSDQINSLFEPPPTHRSVPR